MSSAGPTTLNRRTKPPSSPAGGQAKKKEGTLAPAYDLNGSETVEDVRRVVEVAIFETLSLDNGVA